MEQREIRTYPNYGELFVRNMTHHRKLKGFTQESLAEASGVSRAYINQLENGRSNAPSINTAMAVAIAMDMSLEELCMDLLTTTPTE